MKIACGKAHPAGDYAEGIILKVILALACASRGSRLFTYFLRQSYGA
jgi:hypothetical protein